MRRWSILSNRRGLDLDSRS